MNIKKQFESIHSLLVENQGKKLGKELMSKLEELMISKTMTKTFKLDDEGNVSQIFCYYHKVWEDVNEIPYGKKSSTSHGLNTMCKQGVSNWTKQQRVLKVAKEELLSQVADETIQASDLPSIIKELEIESKTIKPYEV